MTEARREICLLVLFIASGHYWVNKKMYTKEVMKKKYQKNKIKLLQKNPWYCFDFGRLSITQCLLNYFKKYEWKIIISFHWQILWKFCYSVSLERSSSFDKYCLSEF